MLHLPTLRFVKSNFIRFNVALFFAAIATASFAASVTQYNFDGSVVTASSVDANATASTFTQSAGANSFFSGNPSTGQAISGTGWNGADGAKFWEFTVTANGGFALNLSSLTFDDQKSTTGPTSWTVVVNGTTVLSSQATHTSITSGNNSVSLSGLTFQNLGSVDVKISGFSATSSAGTWRVDNVTLNGTVDRAVASAPDSLPFAFEAMVMGGVMLLYLGGRVRLAPVRVRS